MIICHSLDSLGWIELKTPAGKTYYQDSIKKTTQWSRPGAPLPEKKPKAKAPDDHASTVAHDAAKVDDAVGKG